MVNAYWEIGEQIYHACGENERAAYGKQLLQYISEKLTAEFGKGFELMNEGDNPPIGILLCADKSDTLVRYTLPEDNKQIYAAKYLPYMPTEEELRRELNLDDFKKLSD